MQLLANENFPLASIKILRSVGFDITSIGIDYSGILDSEVIKTAKDEHRMILTFDRDYGELIFRKGYKPEAGVIYFRWESFQPEEPGEYLLELFKTNMQFEGKLTVISETNIRQRGFRQQ